VESSIPAERQEVIDAIKKKKKELKLNNLVKKTNNRPVLPRTAGAKSVADLEEKLAGRGLNTSKVAAKLNERAKSRERGRKRTRDTDDVGVPREHSMDTGEEGRLIGLDGNTPTSVTEGEDGKESKGGRARSSSKATSRARSSSHAPRSKTPADVGLRDVRQKREGEKISHLSQKIRVTTKGEGDRHVFDFKPKHLFSGKRKGQHTASHR
jgi:nucleolar GTP-binding protein